MPPIDASDQSAGSAEQPSNATQPAVKPIPRWKSHKIVQAALILAVTLVPPSVPADSKEQQCATLDLGDYGTVNVDTQFVARNTNTVPGQDKLDGGYLVIYENGYLSWSPADAFEKGYTRLDESPSDTPYDGDHPWDTPEAFVHDFAQALKASVNCHSNQTGAEDAKTVSCKLLSDLGQFADLEDIALLEKLFTQIQAAPSPAVPNIRPGKLNGSYHLGVTTLKA